MECVIVSGMGFGRPVDVPDSISCDCSPFTSLHSSYYITNWITVFTGFIAPHSEQINCPAIALRCGRFHYLHECGPISLVCSLASLPDNARRTMGESPYFPPHGDRWCAKLLKLPYSMNRRPGFDAHYRFRCISVANSVFAVCTNTVAIDAFGNIFGDIASGAPSLRIDPYFMDSMLGGARFVGGLR